MKINKGLEIPSCEESLRPSTVQPRERSGGSHQCIHLKGMYKDDEARLFSVVINETEGETLGVQAEYREIVFHCEGD